MGQIKFTISLVLISLFTFAIIGFGIGFASDNDAAISIDDDVSIDNLYTHTEGNLSEFSDDSEESYQSILKTTIEAGSESPQNAAPFAVTPGNALGTTKNILQVGYTKIFGTGAGFGIFITTFVGVLVFIFGLYVYKTLRGNPD